MKRTQDLKAQYQLQMDEEGILLAAATILEQRLQRQGRIHSPDQAGSYLVARCAHLPHEVFGVVFLDTKHHILAAEHLFTGTIDGCEVHPPGRRQTCPGAQRRRPHPLPQPPEREP